MEQSIYRICLDIQSGSVPVALDMKRGDTARRIFITLTDGGKPYPIGEDCKAVFTAKKADENPIYNPCQVVGDTIIYDVTPQTTAAPGKLNCEIKLYAPEDRLVTSAAFTVTVHDAVFNAGDHPASQAEVEALTRLVCMTEDLVEEVQQKLDSGAFKGEPGEVNIDDGVIGDAAWSGKNIMDRLCPGFSVSGEVVTCEPVEGYPMTVATDPDATRITRCGKNLFDTKGEVKEVWYKNSDGAIVFKNGFEICLPPGTYTVHAEKATTSTADRWIYGVVTDTKYNAFANCNIVIGQNRYNRTITMGDGDRLLLYNGTTGGTLESAQNLLTKYFDIQVEQGSVATAYESYAGGSFAVGEAIPALPGINYLYADAGSITVSGRVDPVTVIEKLTNAIIALGGNI